MTRRNESGGGLTGATGDLTPDDTDRPFIPAEQRGISSAEPDGGLDDRPEPLAGAARPSDGDGDADDRS